MMLRKTILYTKGNDLFNGFFKFVRSQNLLGFVNVTSHDFTQTTDFCGVGASGSKASGIIDGNFESCWCNMEEKDEYTKINIEIGLGSFQLYDFVFRSACGIPETLLIKGSNNGLNYVDICTITDIEFAYTSSIHRCFSKGKAYRYFEIRQIGKSQSNEYKLHVAEIEFFGSLNPLLSFSSMHIPINRLLKSFSLFLLIVKENINVTQ